MVDLSIVFCKRLPEATSTHTLFVMFEIIGLGKIHRNLQEFMVTHGFPVKIFPTEPIQEFNLTK